MELLVFFVFLFLGVFCFHQVAFAPAASFPLFSMLFKKLFGHFLSLSWFLMEFLVLFVFAFFCAFIKFPLFLLLVFHCFSMFFAPIVAHVNCCHGLRQQAKDSAPIGDVRLKLFAPSISRGLEMHTHTSGSSTYISEKKWLMVCGVCGHERRQS